MNYRRNTLLAGIASLALVAGAGMAQAQEKEKAPEGAAPRATQPMNKAPAAAEQPKAGAPKQRAEEMNCPKAMENKTADPKSNAEGAKPAQKAEENERMKQQPQRAEENERTKQPQRAEENERNNKAGSAATEENRSEPSKQDAATKGGENARNKTAAANVHLSTEQRTRIHGIVGTGGPRVAHVNFDVRVGVVVPRGSVEYVPVPETLVQIEPMWQGFYYFVYGDELVIIDPDSLAIVAVVPV